MYRFVSGFPMVRLLVLSVISTSGIRQATFVLETSLQSFVSVFLLFPAAVLVSLMALPSSS